MELCRIKNAMILVMMYVVFGCNVIFGNGVDRIDFYNVTVEDGLKYSNKNMPNDILKKIAENEKAFFNGYGNEEGSEEGWNEWTKVLDAYDEVKHNIANENVKSEIQIITNGSKNINIYLLFVVMFIIISIVLLLKKHKLFSVLFFVCSLILIVFMMFNDKGYKTVKNDISEYLINNNKSSSISKLNDKYDDNYIQKQCNKDWNISYFINDYICKVYDCIKAKSENIEFSDIKINKTNKFYNFAVTRTGKEAKYNLFEDYNKILNENDEDFAVLNDFITYEDMGKIYNSITDKDIKNYNDGLFMDDFVKKIDSVVDHKKDFNNIKNLSISEYFEAIISQDNFSDYDYYILENNNNPLLYAKYWYISGKNRDIELPYGVIMHYTKPEYLKKDINEMICNNYDFLDKNSNDDQYLFNYYRDSSGDYKGAFAKVNFVDEDGLRKAFFNPFDLKYDIKRPYVSATIK